MIENRAGGGGLAATESVAKAPADGYTLLFNGPNHVTNLGLYKNVPYDPVNDFAPVSYVSSSQTILVTHASSGIKTVKELVEAAKAKPMGINYASSGNGTGTHLSMEMFMRATGIQLTHIPFKGATPAFTALAAGQVQVGFTTPPLARQFINEGRLHALAVGGSKRLSTFPAVPSLADLGLLNYDVEVWFGLLAPKGTPPEVVELLARETRRVLNEPGMHEKFDSPRLHHRRLDPGRIRRAHQARDRALAEGDQGARHHRRLGSERNRRPRRSVGRLPTLQGGPMKLTAIVAAVLLISAGMSAHAQDKAKGKEAAKKSGPADMTFFVTSAGKGQGANLGGLEGADAHCNELAKAAGSKRTNWKAYLSTTAPGGDAGVSARERIGKGPWRNAKGVVVATNLQNLHSEKANITKETALTEKGQPVKGGGDKPNEHDMLTGSDPSGRFSTAGGDTTCRNWTSSAEGSAIVGHHDRRGLKDSWNSKSWNSSHGTRGCSQENLVSTGGAGYFYCFAPN